MDWKILFNPDPSKPAQEVLFSRKQQVQIHPTISLNSIRVEKAYFQKHFRILLDEKLNFKQQIDNPILIINKGVSVIKNLDMICHNIQSFFEATNWLWRYHL